MNKSLLGMSVLAAVAMANNASAQVIVDEQFNYVDQAALDVNWNLGANNTLTLQPGGVASISGGGTNPNIWAPPSGSFSLTPTDANPIVLTGDITSSGTIGSVGTIGLRTGANPLFEMGVYRAFDNNWDGTTMTTVAGAQYGIGYRTISIGQDLNGQDWVRVGDMYAGPMRFEATINSTSVSTRIDLGIDGTWDLSYTESGGPIGAFTDLRVHSPAAANPLAAGGVTVDNIRLEVVPEPSTYALIGLGAAAVMAMRRRKS